MERSGLARSPLEEELPNLASRAVAAELDHPNMVG